MIFINTFYFLRNLPKKCKESECYMAVRKGTCNKLDKDKLHKTSMELWVEGGDTSFSTSKGGKAAGTMFGLESGYDYDDNECEMMVIYGPEDDSDEEIEVIGCGQLVPDGETADSACDKKKSRR